MVGASFTVEALLGLSGCGVNFLRPLGAFFFRSTGEVVVLDVSISAVVVTSSMSAIESATEFLSKSKKSLAETHINTQLSTTTANFSHSLQEL